MKDKARGTKFMGGSLSISEIAMFYRSHLLSDVMPFWEPRVMDREFGGYFTCFDREGRLTDTGKYVWMQARQLWMFSALFNNVEKRESWLNLANHGYEFLVRRAYRGEGRWSYQLSREGAEKQGAISIFTDFFMLAGLCEYAAASGLGRECAPLIESTFASAAKNLNDPEFKDLFHLSWAPERKQHGPYMIALNTFLVAGKILGKERVGSLISECARRILYVFARDEHKLLFESVGRDDAVLDTAEGRLINPGHGLESMWFCIEAGRVYNEPEIINRAVEVSEWLYNCGHDREFGGILSFLDAKNNEPPQMDWHRESRVQWDDKVWWAHAESLCALAHAWSASGDNIWLGRFMDLHDWCQKNFFDPEFKEWYSALARDGTVKVSDKGSCWKAAYHLPRALMKITLLLENHTHAVPDAAERE